MLSVGRIPLPGNWITSGRGRRLAVCRIRRCQPRTQWMSMRRQSDIASITQSHSSHVINKLYITQYYTHPIIMSIESSNPFQSIVIQSWLHISSHHFVKWNSCAFFFFRQPIPSNTIPQRPTEAPRSPKLSSKHFRTPALRGRFRRFRCCFGCRTLGHLGTSWDTTCLPCLTQFPPLDITSSHHRVIKLHKES